MVDCPAEAKSKEMGSSLTCLSADRPPLARTRLDWAAIPFLGFPYLEMNFDLSFLMGRDPPQRCGFVCTFHPTALGLIPKHIKNAFGNLIEL